MNLSSSAMISLTTNSETSIPDLISAALLLAWLAYSIVIVSHSLIKHTHSDQGRVKLPPDPTTPQPTTRRTALYRALLGHLATDLQEDGDSVDEGGFWRHARYHRALAGAASLFLVALQAYRGISFFRTPVSDIQSFTFILECLAVAWIVPLISVLAFTHSLELYRSTLRTAFYTSGLLTARFYLTVIEKYTVLSAVPIDSLLAIISLAIGLAVTIVFGTITQEPVRYRERSRVYNQAVAQKLKEDGGERFEGNVVGTGRSILGRFFSIHMFKVVDSILERDQVDLHELPVLPGNMQAEATTRHANESEKESKRSGRTSSAYLMWSTLMTQRGTLVSTIVCIILERALAYLPYFCLERILAVLDGPGPKQTAWAFASIYVLSKKVENLTSVFRIWNLGLFQIFRGFRAHLVFLLFRKLLTRNVFATAKAGGTPESKALTKPDILNLVSSDVQQLENFVWTVGSILELMLSSAIGCVFIWHLLGASAAWGIAFSFLAYPPAYLLSKWELSLFDKSRGASDERIAATQETVHTIAMIKMSGYEGFTFKRLNDLRQKEFKFQFWARVVGFISAAIYSAGPTLVIIISFGHFTLIRHQHLTASLAFTSIGVFAELRPALTMAPKHIANLLKEVLAVRRINHFLQTEDVEHLNAFEEVSTVTTSGEKALTVTGDITWHQQGASNEASDTIPEDTSVFKLRDLDISFQKGKITLIAGKAGSGKTLLLLGLLGEVKLLRGRISYAVSPILDPDQLDEDMDWSAPNEGVAYVPQVAWLQSLDIRENILFGLTMNESRYKSVLEACGLIPDLLHLEEGDLTEIGERGKTLSGGQKTRVSLARAMYSRAAVLVLDDVLSAVDASTGQHIIKNCFLSPSMSDRTIIIASHAVDAVAPISHHAIFLEDGTSVWQGAGRDLLETEYMSHLGSRELVESPEAVLEDNTTPQTSDDGKKQGSDKMSPKAPTEFEIRKAPAKTPRQMLVDEKRAGGVVESQYWIDLIRMCGGRLFLVTFVLFTLGSIMGPVAERALLRAWTEQSSDSEPIRWVLAYAGISTAVITLTVCQEFTGFYGGYRAMKTSFVQMLDRVLRAPMQFFIRTRAGSIIQRFSGDLDLVIDCAELVGQTTMALGQGIVSLVSITWFAGWRFAAAILLMVILYRRPAHLYRVSSRQVRRLKAILPGPVNAHYGETLTGAPVIRAFSAQGLHVRQLLRLTNMEQSTAMIGYMIGRWMWIHVEFFDFVVLVAALCLILTTPGMTGSKAGFIMGFAQTIASEFEGLVVCLREYDLQGVTLERLVEYRELETEDIPSFVDAPKDQGLASRSQLIDESWPQRGRISVEGLCARYADDLPNVLSDISFQVAAGERIGIVGATGCGKSSLAKAFFSFIDITKGSIQIDDKDLSLLPLDIARGRLGIIGQDPMLVTGSLRLNLDIESSHSDEDLFGVLRRIQLLDQATVTPPESEPGSEQSSMTVVAESGTTRNRNVFEDLDNQVLNAGENLSAGEKQLIVLARALLQKRKVLILDEATASVDSKTDLVVTRLIHEEFKGSTILIIAHRLRTIMPCDKIIVMDKGQIVQFDTPSALLDLGQGAFFDLCKAAGEEEFRQLCALTQTADSLPIV